MTDLQCPVRVHLCGATAGDRIAVVLERRGHDAAAVVAELAEVADLHRGEAVALDLLPDVRRQVAVRLVGDPAAVVLEGDAEGWRAVR